MVDENYELRINVTRHGPKSDIDGDLTPEGIKVVFKHFNDSQKKFGLRDYNQYKIVSSPIKRVVETAQLYCNFLKEESNLQTLVVELDEKLSEYELVKFIQHLTPDKQEQWFQYWYESTEGNEVINNFRTWLKNKISDQKKSGVSLQIDAFTHGPVMAGFILKLEEQTRVKIISADLEDLARLDNNILFESNNSFFGYLSCFEIHLNSEENPDIFTLKINNRVFQFGLDVL